MRLTEPLERKWLKRHLRDIRERAGWGPRLTWPVTGAGEGELLFALRIPLEWKTVDALDRPPGEPGSLNQVMTALARSVDAAGVIAAQCIFRMAGEHAPVFATVTAARADVAGPPPESVPGAEVERASLPVGGGVRVKRTREAELVPGRDPMPVLIVQYLLETGHGALALTFTTPQHAIFDEFAELFEKIAQTAWLGPPAELHELPGD